MFIFLLNKGIYKKLALVYFLPVLAIGNQRYNLVYKMLFYGIILGARYYSKIGFVGLGNMGGHMAKNLLKKVKSHENV